MAAKMNAVDILMVGKTGNGKSALGNMILQKQTFKSRNDLESVTKDIQVDSSQFEDTVIKVVDGPGVGDTIKDKVKAVSLVVEAMTRAVMTSKNGFHTILIVVRYGGRFTDEDIKTIKILKDIFGESFVTNHAILVMTCGDLFMIDAEENDDETFGHWCQRQGGIFSELLKEVDNRVILVNNKSKGERSMAQIRCLLHMIEGLCINGARYTSKLFSEASLSRNRLVVESTRPLIQENTILEAGRIHQQLGRIDDENPLEKMGCLNLLKGRAEYLLETITEQDKGTKALSVAIKVAENLVKTITQELRCVQKSIIKLREEEETYWRSRKM